MLNPKERLWMIGLYVRKLIAVWRSCLMFTTKGFHLILTRWRMYWAQNLIPLTNSIGSLCCSFAHGGGGEYKSHPCNMWKLKLYQQVMLWNKARVLTLSFRVSCRWYPEIGLEKNGIRHLDKAKNWILGKCPFPPRRVELACKKLEWKRRTSVTSESGIKKTAR